jgi:hypothetical protein
VFKVGCNIVTKPKNIKTFTTNFKAAFFTVLFGSTITTAFSQGTTSSGYSIESCYQIILPSNANPTLNVLRAGTFGFKYTNNAGARPDQIRIKMYDQMGGFLGYDYHGIGIADDLFTVSLHPDHGVLVAVEGWDEWAGKWVVNRNSMIFPDDVATVEISTFHWTGDQGNQTLDESTRKLRFNLISLEDAFTLESQDGSCFTFDNFNVSISNMLDGFCGTLINPILSIAPPPPIGSGWSSTFTKSIPFHTPLAIDLPTNSNGLTWCEEKCTDVTAPAHSTYPVPCGCVDFFVDLKLAPCPTSDADCPIIDLRIPISVCCDCDVRAVGQKM